MSLTVSARHPASYLYICGSYRSGTTVTEKLLNSHGDVCVASQPFPLLFIMSKERFNATCGIRQTYPLDHRFLQATYTDEQFVAFLELYVFTPADIAEFAKRMETYIGVWTPRILEHTGRLRSGNFFALYEQLMVIIHDLYGSSNTRYTGSKEVLFEEYIPFFLQKGVKTLLVIRDPRDMIASLNFNELDNQTGDNRPVLYSLRNWRKSVAYAIQFAGREHFLHIRYEDLVSDCEATIGNVARFLRLPDFAPGLLALGLRDQEGKPWLGNSAYHKHYGLSSRSIGTFRKRLSVDIIEYIENICQPEMGIMGYTPERAAGFSQKTLWAYRDPFARIHASFPPDYSHTNTHIEDEIQRHAYLTNRNCPPEKIRDWFIYPKPYAVLSEQAIHR